MGIDRVEEYLLDRGAELVWELFHENSKTSFHERHPYFARHPSDAAVVSIMRRLRAVKPFTDRPKLALPRELPPAGRPFHETILARTTARSFGIGPLTLVELAAILRLSAGVTRDNLDTAYPRPFRVTPSGGALYPLELYVVADRVEGLEPGLYHYDPEEHELDALRAGDELERLADCLVQRELAREAAAAVLVAAVFFRSTVKYGDRGYRFVLLEAGHLAQNALLAAEGMDIAAAPIGGYLDRDVDQLLGLDGIDESVVYALLFGRSSS